MADCGGDICKCGTTDIRWSELSPGERYIFYAGSGAILTVVGLGMPYAAGAAGLLISVYLDGDPVVISTVPATKESVAEGFRSAGWGYNVSPDGKVTYTGIGDSNAGDEKWMRARQKELDDFFDSLPSAKDFCHCNNCSHGGPDTGQEHYILSIFSLIPQSAAARILFPLMPHFI